MECKTHNIQNMLYGFFDGYDYTEQIIFSRELAEITHENPAVGAEISAICGIVEKYAKLQNA
jgi:hypothetical protein